MIGIIICDAVKVTGGYEGSELKDRTLSNKALHPSTFERQNVKLALQIFNDFTSNALTAIGQKYDMANYFNTSIFIKIITTWWKIVNVKTPLKGLRLNNDFEKPITMENCQSSKFLKYVLTWIS